LLAKISEERIKMKKKIQGIVVREDGTVGHVFCFNKLLLIDWGTNKDRKTAYFEAREEKKQPEKENRRIKMPSGHPKD
jgi:hypothetical protein